MIPRRTGASVMATAVALEGASEEATVAMMTALELAVVMEVEL
jgi:hypothetical protein